MTVYKSDPKSKLKKKKTVPRLPRGGGGVRDIKRELNAAFNQWKSENLLIVIAISIIATKNRI